MNALYELLKEGHKHPFFNLFLAVVLFSFMGFSLQYFAVADEVTENRKMLSEIQVDLKRSALEGRIHDIESEIFTLERVISEGQARPMDHERLARLRSELGTAKRELERLDNQ